MKTSTIKIMLFIWWIWVLILWCSCTKEAVEIVKVEKKQPIEISLESVNIVGDTSLLINYIVK